MDRIWYLLKVLIFFLSLLGNNIDVLLPTCKIPYYKNSQRNLRYASMIWKITENCKTLSYNVSYLFFAEVLQFTALIYLVYITLQSVLFRLRKYLSVGASNHITLKEEEAKVQQLTYQTPVYSVWVRFPIRFATHTRTRLTLFCPQAGT